MKRFVLLLVVVGIVQYAWAWGLSGGLSFGLVTMDFLNARLQDLANREGSSVSPLRLGLELEAGFWPWRWLGFGLEWLSSSGGVYGREEYPLSAQGLSLALFLGWNLEIAGFSFPIQGGIGPYWFSVTGFLEGWSLGLGGEVSVGLVFLRVAGLEALVETGGRIVRGSVLQTPRSALAPQDMPALDFSGLFFGFKITWK